MTSIDLEWLYIPIQACDWNQWDGGAVHVVIAKGFSSPQLSCTRSARPLRPAQNTDIYRATLYTKECYKELSVSA